MRTVNALLSTLLIVALACVGCDRAGQTPKDLSMTELKGKLDGTFKGANPQVKAAEAQLAAALAENNAALSFAQARALAAMPDLTPSEREAAAQAVVSTVKELKKAADGGSTEAAEVYHSYISSR